VIDWALANGMPRNLLGGLLALAGQGKTSPPTDGASPSGNAPAAITAGEAATINPPPLAGMKAAAAPVSADEVREIVADTLHKFISSETFLTKLAEAGEAKVAAAEATDVAKAATTDLTTKVSEVQGEVQETRSAVEDLRKSLTAEIERIKALPQAPKAATGALPQGVHPVEKSFAANPSAPAPAADTPPELADLIRRASAGDWKAGLEVTKRMEQANAQKAAAEDMLRATYAAKPAA
jgi:hypothetical protein